MYSIFLRKTYSNSLDIDSNLLISAGFKGWESIEFKELLLSAQEYLGKRSVHQHILLNNKKYISEIEFYFKNKSITHFFYDPRTGNQSLFGGITESIYLSILCTKYNVIPIVYFTDISCRIWRIKGSILSSISGIGISFVAPRLAWPILPHNRLYGPSLMPFSVKTLNEIQEKINRQFSVNKNLSAYFIGSLYEPRTTKLNNIKNGLKERNLTLNINGRQLGSKRKSDLEYWMTIIEAPIIITTSDQIISSGFDWTWIPNLVYRYLEALISGTLLIAPSVPCIERYFEPGVHFVSFDSEIDAIDKIEYYLLNHNEREIIARSGMLKAKSLVESKIFWLNIDSCLSIKSLK